MKKNKIMKVAIIGRGPAGMATAIQLNKYCSESLLLFSKEGHFGLLPYARIIENYPGFPDGIAGVELWDKFYAQVLKSYVQQVFHDVDLLDFIEQEKLFVITVGGDVYYARYVVVATGTMPRQIELLDSMISSNDICVYYDIAEVIKQQNKKVAIVGAGDAALDYALNVAKNNLVAIFNRGAYINASFSLQEQIKDNKNITYHKNAKLINVQSNATSKQLLTFQQEQNIINKEFDYLVVAIGRVPNKAFYTDNLVNLEPMLIANKLLYLVGDIKNNIYRQVAIAVGDGILAAMQLKELVA